MPLTVSHFHSDTFADNTGTLSQMNSNGNSATFLATNLVKPSNWDSLHACSVSMSGSEAYFSDIFWEPFEAPNTNSTLSTPAAGSWFFDPFVLPKALGSGCINLFVADTSGFNATGVVSRGSSGAFSAQQTLNTILCIYQIDSGANTTRLTSVWSTQVSILGSWNASWQTDTGNANQLDWTHKLTFSFPAQWDSLGSMTYSSTAFSTTDFIVQSTAAISAFLSSDITKPVAYVTGSKIIPVPMATLLPAGAYYLGYMRSSSSATSTSGQNYGSAITMFSTQSVLHQLDMGSMNAYKRMGQSTSNVSTCILPFHGVFSQTTATPPSTIGTGGIRNTASGHRLVWNYAVATTTLGL